MTAVMLQHLYVSHRRDGTDCIDSVEIKLLSLATGAMHTAADGAISLSLPPSYSSTARDASDSPATDTALAGDFIGIMLSILRDGQHDDMICYLWVCNWKTGELKVASLRLLFVTICLRYQTYFQLYFTGSMVWE